MARNECTIAATPERVFETLVDAGAYAHWVVGAKAVRTVDPKWPEPGSAFHHELGIGPLTVKDATTVLAIDPPRRIVLRAYARPLWLVADVVVTLEAADGGTRVVMEEQGVQGPARGLLRPIADRVLALRNEQALRRLKEVVETGEQPGPLKEGRHESPEPSQAARLIAAPFALGFGALSFLRRKRVFHPFGQVYEGQLRVWRQSPDLPKAELLEDRATLPAIVRLSRGAGLPEPLPDVLGIGLRIPHAYGPERHQDFLLVTSAEGRVGNRLLVPATGFFGRSYSSILPYRIGAQTVVFGLLPVASPLLRSSGFEEVERAAASGFLHFRLAVAYRDGRWRPIGDLHLTERIDGENIALNPWNTGADIRPTGALNALRDAAYRASQAARPADRSPASRRHG